MTIRQFMSYSIGFMAITCYVGTAGAEKPTRDIYKYTATYEADEVWYDYFGYYGACGFPFMVDVDARYTTHYLKGRELINILIRDTYTNLDTGFSFEDFGSYKIVVDYETGLADHRGVFWRIRIPGEGVVLLDVGSFLQDWSGPWPWPIVEGTLIGNNHDVNGPISEGELPPVSYCDLMSGTFPE